MVVDGRTVAGDGDVTIPYSQHSVEEEDVRAVEAVLRSDWLTTGPKVREFEDAFAEYVGAKHAISFSSGTAALHAAYLAAGVDKNTRVSVPALTFVATSNAILYCGGRPIFCDVDEHFLTLREAGRLSGVIVPMDHGGHPANYDELQDVAEMQGAVLVSDSCHALGATYKGRKVGSLANMTCFSFHPCKHLATGEGGMVSTDGDEYAEKLRLIREHGRVDGEMVTLGFNYRMSDIAAALGLSQLRRIESNLARRREIAARYCEALDGIVETPYQAEGIEHAWHLYVIRVPNREVVRQRLAELGVGTQVHYSPIVPLQKFYREKYGYAPGNWPVAEKAAGDILSIPMFHGLTDEEVETVVKAVKQATA